MTPPVHTCRWFHRRADEAARFYSSVFPVSRITGVLRQMRKPDIDPPERADRGA